jgi:hypothetical protein
LERLRRLVARHDVAMSWGLAALVILVASHQLVVSAGGVLTPWKGGGFGMYTTPHGIHSRATFLSVNGYALRLAPPDPAFLDWVAEVDPASADYLMDLQERADGMRPYPQPDAAERLMAAASKVVWDKALFGAAVEIGRQPASAMQVTVIELARRPSVGRFETREVFRHAGQ